MFITKLFTVVKIQRQPRCLSVDEWTENMWHIYTMRHYSATRKQSILPFVTTLDLPRLYYAESETSQTERQDYATSLI